MWKDFRFFNNANVSFLKFSSILITGDKIILKNSNTSSILIYYFYSTRLLYLLKLKHLFNTFFLVLYYDKNFQKEFLMNKIIPIKYLQLTSIIFALLFLASSTNFAQGANIGEAKGLFFSVAVGPRFPVGKFAEQQTIGVGFDAILSYTDNVILPIFAFLKIGYNNFPGDFNYYRNSDHSSITTNMISFSGGVKHYFAPVINDMVLLMPIVEGGVSVAYLEKLHQFKIDRRRPDVKESLTKAGFHVGGGFTIFLMEIMAKYNYLNGNQFLSFDLRLTMPLAVIL